MKEKIKHYNIVRRCLTLTKSQKEHIKKKNSNWPEIPDHSYQMLRIGGSGSGKANALLNLINNEPDIDKIYLHAKNSYEAKYQLLINKRESTGYKYNLSKKQKILVIFDDMIADMLSNKKLNY